MQEISLGDLIIIGNKHSLEGSYDSFVGSKARINIIIPDKVIVEIIQVKNPIFSAYIGESLYISKEDCLPFVEHPSIIEDTPKENISVSASALIEITGTYAEQMDYVQAVGHLCMIEYVESAYVQVVVLSGPLTGEVRDVHIDDVVREREVEPPSNVLMILDDEKEEFVYIPSAQEKDPAIKQKISFQLDSAKSKGSRRRVIRGDLTHTIGYYGYKMKHIDDIELPAKDETPF